MPLVLNSFPEDQVQKISKEMRDTLQTSCDVSPCFFTPILKEEGVQSVILQDLGTYEFFIFLTFMMALHVFLVLDFVEQHQNCGVTTSNYRRA